MKFPTIAAVLVILACGAYASKLSDLIPSFPSGFVIKGQDAVEHSAPYIISLSTRSGANHSHICGGSIINKEWILTAAHCVANATGMGVMAGLHKRSNVTDRTQSRVVDFGKVHELYTGGVGPYDIAILHVSAPFEFNAWVQPVTLPAREETHSGITHLYGWGQPKAYQIWGAQTLQTVETEIVNYNECKAKLPEDAPLYSNNICSDSRGQSISACQGDSGGPLVVETVGAPAELIGITSWVYIPCGLANMPSVYTRVSNYTGWVVDVQSAYYDKLTQLY